MKKILIYIVLVAVVLIGIAVYFVNAKKEEVVVTPKEPIDTCYQMSQIDCERLQDQNLVEKYVRENINTIVTEKPVLGGSWYVTVVNISPSTKSGTMILTYEDGHIQGKSEFSYTINGTQVTVTPK